MYILINYEKVFRYLDNEKAKNSTNLTENEIMALLQLMFELGTQYNKVSGYNLDSYIKKFYNKFSSKRGLQLKFFLEIIMTLEPNKPYKPKEINKIISNNFRNFVPNLLNNLGLVNDEQLISIKKDEDLISPGDMTELLQIMTDDLNILEKINGIKKIKKIQGAHPGRKDNTTITNFEGFPSWYKLSKDFIIIKNLLNKPESCLMLRNFINKNQHLKNHFIFSLNTIHFNTSYLLNKKVKTEDKERLRNELYKKLSTQQGEFIHILHKVLLFSSKEEINKLSRNYIDAILSTNDYTYLLFLIKFAGLINKL
jgi:hypothetical protein